MKTAIASGNFQPSKVLRIAIPLQYLTKEEKKYWEQDEISIDGRMYDVVCAKHTDDSLIINCLSDDDETELVNTFLQAVHNNHGNLPGTKITNLSGLFLPFVLTNDFIFPARIEISNVLHANRASVQFSSADAAGVLTPPPRQA